MPPAPRPSGPKTKPPLTNPTSTKATVYTYTCIALILLYQYLDDNPRHLRYRETQRKEAGSKRDHHTMAEVRVRVPELLDLLLRLHFHRGPGKANGTLVRVMRPWGAGENTFQTNLLVGRNARLGRA
jgi:hypothetical protein